MIENTETQLTDEAFWDDFWESTQLPAVVDRRLSYERCLSDTFARYLRPDPSQRLFEVGCAPGRWLIWFHKMFGYQVFGCEASPLGLQKTLENLKLTGVRCEVYAENFLNWQPPEHDFDIVVSLGFIEHFADPDLVIRKHLALLKPGGTLILHVPNLTGLNYLLMRVTHQHGFLQRHNLKIMNRSYFRHVAATNGLKIRFLGYVGSFEPALFELRGRPMWVKAIHKSLRTVRSLPGADRVNSSLFSGYLVGVFES